MTIAASAKGKPARGAIALLATAMLLTFLPARKSDDAQAASSHARDPKDVNAVPLRIGLVFDVGGRGDKSFNDAAYRGLMRAKDELGVEASFLEPVGSEDREAAMRLFAAQGFDLVIGVGFIFSSDVDRVARDYPSSRFACVDYSPGKEGIPPNVLGLQFREEEGSFLVGAVAGFMSRTHHVGFVGGMSGPLIRKFEVGYIGGVKAACPECIVHSAYAGASPDAFRDPSKGKALAIREIAAGADVIYHASGATGHGVFEAAHDASVWAIGVDADQYDEMPGTILTSMIKRGDVAVLEAIRAVGEHRFEGGIRDLGLHDGAIAYVRDGDHAAQIPDAVKVRVDALREDVIAGRVHVRVD